MYMIINILLPDSIDSLDCLCPLWLARLITVTLVLLQQFSLIVTYFKFVSSTKILHFQEHFKSETGYGHFKNHFVNFLWYGKKLCPLLITILYYVSIIKFWWPVAGLFRFFMQCTVFWMLLLTTRNNLLQLLQINEK